MKRFLAFVGLSAAFLAAVATAAGLVAQEPVKQWFKQGFYVGKLSAAPTSSSTNLVTGTFGKSAVIDVASVTGGTCTDTPVTLADAGTAYMPGNVVGDACAVGTPAAPQANVSFSCFVPSSNAVTLRACALTTADPASATYFFRTVSGQ